MLGRSLARPRSFLNADYKGSTATIAVSWLALLAAGLGGFVWVRDMVIVQRQEMMRERRALKFKVEESIK